MSSYYTIVFIINVVFIQLWVMKYCDDGDAFSLLATIAHMLLACYCILRMMQA